MVAVVDVVALTMDVAVTGAITRVPSPELANFTLFGILTVTLRPLIIPFIGRGGDDDIKDDDDETQLEDEGDGDGVDGVGESRVSDMAEMFLAVNESAALLTLVILLFAKATLVFVGDVPVGLV